MTFLATCGSVDCFADDNAVSTRGYELARLRRELAAAERGRFRAMDIFGVPGLPLTLSTTLSSHLLSDRTSMSIPHPYHRRTRNVREQPETTGGRNACYGWLSAGFPWSAGTPEMGGARPHNPKVAGSNPAPATESPGQRPADQGFYRLGAFFYRPFYRRVWLVSL